MPSSQTVRSENKSAICCDEQLAPYVAEAHPTHAEREESAHGREGLALTVLKRDHEVEELEGNSGSR